MSNPFIGCWRLLSFHSTIGETVLYPLGREVSGYIIYSADGYMSVAFMSTHRSRFASTDLQNGSKDEKATAMEQYFSYCGRYEIDYDHQQIRHLIEVCLFPNWIGEIQERCYQLEGNRLILSTPPLLIEAKKQIGYLVWERVN